MSDDLPTQDTDNTISSEDEKPMAYSSEGVVQSYDELPTASQDQILLSVPEETIISVDPHQ